MKQQTNKHNKIFRSFLEEHEKELVREMFWGPYKPEWRLPGGIVDNTDETISQRLGLPKAAVCQFIARECEQHWNRVISLREDQRTLEKDESYISSVISEIDIPGPNDDLVDQP